MCNNCNQSEQNSVPCKECKGSVQVNTDDIFYNTDCNSSLDLTNLNLPTGTSLSTILRKIDYKLGDNLNTVNFNGFNLEYLRTKYPIINNIKTFAESTNLEFLYNKNQITAINTSVAGLNTSLTSLSSELENIKYPNIVDSSGVGFTVNDTINTVLQRIVNKFNSISGGSVSSPAITAINSSSVILNASGVLNHTLTASVKVSSNINNRLQVLADGLYVSPTTVNNQTLSIVGNQLSISGGNTISIPVQGLQQLSLAGNVLTISGGNSISLPSVVETTLVANNSSTVSFTQTGTAGHTISANVKVSSNVGNKITVLSDGIYNGTNAIDVLNDINNNSSLKAIFCNIASSCTASTCFKWFISNTSGTSATVTYTDQNDVVQSTTISGTSTATITGTKINTNPTSTLIITFLGKC